MLRRQKNMTQSLLAEILNTTTDYLLCGKVCVAGIENNIFFSIIKGNDCGWFGKRVNNNLKWKL